MARDPKTGRFPARPENPKGGDGWGGDAKGAGKGPEALPPGSYTRENLAAKAARAAEMERVLYEIAVAGEHETNRLNAAYKLKTLIDGLPVAKQVNISANAFDGISDEQLAAAADELRAALGAATRDDGSRDSGAGEQEPAQDIPPVH